MMFSFCSHLTQKAHDSMVSAMVCSKEYLYTSSLGCIKASAKTRNCVVIIHFGVCEQHTCKLHDHQQMKDNGSVSLL